MWFDDLGGHRPHRNIRLFQNRFAHSLNLLPPVTNSRVGGSNRFTVWTGTSYSFNEAPNIGSVSIGCHIISTLRCIITTVFSVPKFSIGIEDIVVDAVGGPNTIPPFGPIPTLF